MTPASPFNDLGKMLLIFGVVLVIAGAFLLTGAKLPFRLGRLPGDMAYQRQKWQLLFSDRHLHSSERGAHSNFVDHQSFPPLS